MYNPQIKTFITVADAGSFNKAADLLFISSTAVIKQINLLENHTKVRLFNRTHKGLTLTKAGASFYEDAKYMIQYSDDALRRLQQIERGVSDVVRVGVSPITPVDSLTSLGSTLQDRGIQIQIVPFENNPENAKRILNQLGKDIDIVMGIFDDVTKEYYTQIQTLPVIELSAKILLGSTDVLASKKVIEWGDLNYRRIYVLESQWSNMFDDIATDIAMRAPQANIIRFPFLDTHVFNQCLLEGGLMVGFSIWDKVHPFIAVKDINWAYTINYGVLYGMEPSSVVDSFLDIVHQNIGNTLGLIETQ